MDFSHYFPVNPSATARLLATSKDIVITSFSVCRDGGRSFLCPRRAKHAIFLHILCLDVQNTLFSCINTQINCNYLSVTLSVNCQLLSVTLSVVPQSGQSVSNYRLN